MQNTEWGQLENNAGPDNPGKSTCTLQRNLDNMMNSGSTGGQDLMQPKFCCGGCSWCVTAAVFIVPGQTPRLPVTKLVLNSE